MSRAIAAIILSLALLVSLHAFAAGTDRFCVTRLEDDGSVNIYPIELIVDGKPRASLLGGSSACVPMQSPGHIVFLQWPAFDWQRPDHGLRNTQLISSGKIFVVQDAGQTRARKSKRLFICSAREQGGAPTWDFYAGDGKPCHP